MNPGTRSQSAFNNATRRSPAPGTADANDAAHRRTQSAWENVRAPGLGRSNTTRTPRKNGFDPATPGADEPPVTGTAGYFTTQRRDPQPSPLSGQVPTSSPRSRFSPSGERSPGRGPFGRRSAENMGFVNGSSRIRTPYHSTPGERTYVTNDSIRRSASTRDTTYHSSAKSSTQPTHQTPEPREARHRSASPSPRTPMTSEKVRPQSARFSPEGRNSSGSSGKQGTSSSHSPAFDLNSSTDDSDDDDDDDDDDTSTDETEPSRGDFSRKPIIDTKLSQKAAADMLNRPKAMPSSIWKMRDSRKPSEGVTAKEAGAANLDGGEGSTNDTPGFKFSPSEWDGAFASGGELFAKPPIGLKNGTTQRSNTSRPGYTRARSSSQSAIPTQRRNQSNIGKKTSAHVFNKHEAVPSVPSSSLQQPPQPPRSKQPLVSPATTPPNAAPSTEANLPKKPDFAPLPGEVKFSAAKWAQTLREPNWVLPPQKPPSPEKRPKSVKPKPGSYRFVSTPASKQASVSDVVDESESSGPSVVGSRFGGENGKHIHDDTAAAAPAAAVDDDNDDENAMDIDVEPRIPTPPPPPPSSTLSHPTNTYTGRTEVPSPYNRHSTSTAAASSREPQTETTAKAQPQASPRPSFPSSKPGYPTNANYNSTTTSIPATTPTSNPQPNGISLGALKHVAPFQHASNTGLSDLDPVAQTLPFDSRASSTNALKQTSPLLQLHHLPPTPRAPAPPISLPSSSTSSTNPSLSSLTRTNTTTRLTQKSWTTYLTGMQNYLVAWNAFNRTMLSHFAARQATIDHQMQVGWLGATGEPSDKTKMGFDGYMRALGEDEMVRMHWHKSCERHREVLGRHGRLRERVRRGGVLVE